jgi:transposase
MLVSAGDVWACVLELNSMREARGDRPLVSYTELCRELARPGCFGELSSVGARSVLRRYSDAFFATAKKQKKGDATAHYPRRRRHLMPVRFYQGTFLLDNARVRLPVAKGCPPLCIRLSREVPYGLDQVRSVSLLAEAGRLCIDVCAEVPVATYRAGEAPDPARCAGVDLGVIHPYAVAGPCQKALLVSGRALRAESRLHLAERRARGRAVARRAPRRGQRGSRRWRKYRARTAVIEARHHHRLAQARHEAARIVVDWALSERIGTLVVGDPVGVLELKSGRRHNERLRAWRPGQAKSVLADKAVAAGICVHFVDERSSSSTCPRCLRRVAKPKGRSFACPHCGLVGHRDIVGAVNIASRMRESGELVSMPNTTTHRRAGRHLPGAGRSRRDPRRTRWEISRELREFWPAVARPEETLGSSSNPEVVFEDQPMLANTANVG